MSIAGVIASASLGIASSSASANDVWLWACHGPSGQPIGADLGTSATGDARAAKAGNACGGAAAADGYKLSFANTAPANDSRSSVTVSLPAGLSAKAVKVNRSLAGFDGATGVSYKLTANGQQLESNAAPGTGAINLASPSNSVTLELSCSAACTGSPTVDVSSVALLVSDTTAPQGGANWNTPVDKEMPITLAFTDSGVGLDRAVVTVDGFPGATREAKFGTCDELSPGDATNDRPLNADACRTGQTRQDGAGNPLPQLPIGVAGDPKALYPDPLALPEGLFKRTVTVYDAAGNAAVVNGDVEVWHPPAPVSVRELNISTASVTEQGSNNNNGNNNNGGGVRGDSATSCRTPRLSVTLRSKPVRVSKNTPILRYKKSYRFTGRLTCVINGKRQSAPKRTKVSILNKVGKKTVRKPNTAIRSKGAVDLKLAFVSSRTVIFRYANAAGQKSEVKIKVRVTKKKS